MNSPFYDVPGRFAHAAMPSPQNAETAAANRSAERPMPSPHEGIPLYTLSGDQQRSRPHEAPSTLEQLASRLGLRTPGQSTDSPIRRADDQLVSDSTSGDALVSALMNGHTTSSSDADFIINICNQDDLLITDPILVQQFKSKGIPRSTSALLDALDDNKTFKKTKIAFETQLKTLTGPQLTNAVKSLLATSYP
jgi:hypothetical protein